MGSGDSITPPCGRCRVCGHPLERAEARARKKLQWSCTNTACASKSKASAWTVLERRSLDGKLLKEED